jgi:WhiB family redox-sensing transcriptional regulator
MNIHDLDFEQAACTNADPEVFFDGTNRESVAIAKSYCGICPIAIQCLTYAMANEDHGIWGGATPQERLLARNNPRAYKELVVSITPTK